MSATKTDSGPTDSGCIRPLDGVRVIDVGNFLAGPYAGTIMAEFGAEVIKIEHPQGGDPMRRYGTTTARPDATLKWLSESRNKKSVTCDLRQPAGVALLLKLVAKADVLIENFRPEAMESWGLGWDVLHAANPRLVMLRVTGYGQTGPYRRRAGFAHIAQAFGGLNYLAGFPGETPVLPGTVPLGDYVASLFGAIGTLIALRHAEQTGRGQIVDVGIYEAIFRILEEIAAAYGLHGVVREREGSGSFVACPHGHFRTRDDRWIAIACTTDKMFERLAAAMGRPELAAAELYGDQRKRLAARETVDALVIDWVASLERQVILDRCLEMEVPAGKVNSIADIFDDEHFQARENLLSREAEGLGDVVVPGVVPRLSKTPGRVTHLGPTLGDATVAVLTGLLQLNAAEIAALRDKKII
ncbi:MAG: CoA transferase [Gammaproteobacteria bacterium]|nr:CoA transferase [Gammaproteobacteria bacterium]MBM4208940.1 CoA transferase [Gammaproteobacteria bacterium]MBM4223531.1 CoA transferase [Gammaproteobacteria bacterium]MBM4229478.1 CoA transferase [Gammaproteobacteria bacterium]